MKKLSFLLVCSVIGTTVLMTSCSEDYPGPDPVDVTANYSSKSLTLTYDGNEMTGKSVDFSTVKGKTANITLYDVIPGEEVLRLIDIPISGNATGYSFSGNATGSNTNSTFDYEGRAENGKLTISLTNVKMANNSQVANTYALSEIIYGRGKSMIRNPDTGLYEWGEADNKMIASPLYVDMDVALNSDGSFLYATMTSLVKGMGGYLLAQLLEDVTLEPNGCITANYTTDEMMLGDQKFSEINMDDEVSMNKVATFITYKLFLPYPMGGFQQQDIKNATVDVNRSYIPSPKGMAYWYMKNDIFYLKLDFPAIITQVMKSQGIIIDQSLITLLTDAIVKSDPAKFKNILNTINGLLNNSMLSTLASLDNETFQMLFSWIQEGIPMHLEKKDGHAYLYITKELLTPFIGLLPGLEPLMAGIPNFGPMLFNSYIMPLYEGWPLITKLNIGVDLVANN